MKTAHVIDTGASYRVGKILCLGRNYAEHAREMHSDLPTDPVVFLKPSTAIIHDGESIILPSFSNELHHEVEVVVLIGSPGKNVERSQALQLIEGYGIGLDMTLRDVQSKAKKQGLPWSVAKGFDTSAPVSVFKSRKEVPDAARLSFSLSVNGEVRQKGNVSDMIFPIDYTLSYLSRIFTLEPGDLVFTGTPEGVAAVRKGDILEARLDQVASLKVSVN